MSGLGQCSCRPLEGATMAGGASRFVWTGADLPGITVVRKADVDRREKLARTGVLTHTAGMRELAGRAWSAWDQACESVSDVVVSPAMPILYFGDARAYLASPVRVVTVALNPSLAEFPTGDPWLRFPSAPERVGPTKVDMDLYLASLDDYYKAAPYTRWFASFEPILLGMNASFYPGQASTVLHTDLCSPVPTDPTWSHLPETVRAELIGHGRALWHALMVELRPQVILVSVAGQHLPKIHFPATGDTFPVHTVDRARPYVVTAKTVAVTEDTQALLVSGRASQTPFGSISAAAKRAVGEAILERLRD
ncbi:MAG: hypothetical protein ACYDAQ_02070 [Mycobacteriales bacterium]